MRIGIVTIWDDTNLGNRLQNYAMSYILSKKMGCKVVTLRSLPLKKQTFIQKFKERIVLSSCIFPRLAAKRFGVDTVRYSRINKWNRKIASKIFLETKEIPHTIDKQFDYFISGSDQIWNYTFCAGRFHDYFLQFADPEKRIAVSASIGLNSINEEWKEYYANQLKSYKAISVREDRAKQIVEELSGRSATVLADPVMAMNIEDWRKVERKPKVDLHKNYILLYILGTIGQEVKAKINQWEAEGNCAVYNMFDKNALELFTCGPAEFLSLIENAKLVVTDSFHCSAFSIIYNTPFVVIKRNDNQQDMWSRLDTLLQKYALDNRREEKAEDVFHCDFSYANSVIKQEQNKFMRFLQSSLMQ